MKKFNQNQSPQTPYTKAEGESQRGNRDGVSLQQIGKERLEVTANLTHPLDTEEVDTHNHEWIVDPRFDDGSIIMMFGEVGKVKPEKRYVCACGEVEYK